MSTVLETPVGALTSEYEIHGILAGNYPIYNIYKLGNKACARKSFSQLLGLATLLKNHTVSQSEHDYVFANYWHAYAFYQKLKKICIKECPYNNIFKS